MLMHLEFSEQIFEKYSRISFNENTFQSEPSCFMWTGRWTDVMKLQSLFALLRTLLRTDCMYVSGITAVWHTVCINYEKNRCVAIYAYPIFSLLINNSEMFQTLYRNHALRDYTKWKFRGNYGIHSTRTVRLNRMKNMGL